MSRDADQLRAAFESRQLDRLIELMDPQVTWRGVHRSGEDVAICRDRAEVRQVMVRAIERGVDGRPLIIGESGDSVVIDPQASPASAAQLHQILTFRGGRIVLMQDYPDRNSAMAAIAPVPILPTA